LDGEYHHLNQQKTEAKKSNQENILEGKKHILKNLMIFWHISTIYVIAVTSLFEHFWFFSYEADRMAHNM